MPHSPLVGTDSSPRVPRGRDTDALGPSDNTDSGSDIAGLDDDPGGDPMLPVDVAMRDEHPHGLVSRSSAGSWGGDAAGTGERRSAGGDAGPEAADIGVDRVFTPGADGDIDDHDLSALDDATAADDAMDVGADEDDEDDVDAALRDARDDAVRAGEPEAGGRGDVDDLDDDLDEAESARMEHHGHARGGGAGGRRDGGLDRPGRH